MPEKIDHITPEQEAMIPEWVEKWRKVDLCTDPADFERAENAVRELYKAIDHECPPILRVQSPKAAVKTGVDYVFAKKGEKATKKDYMSGIYNSYGGSPLAAWNAYITFFRDVLNWENETLETFKWGEELCLSCAWVWWHEDVCVISDRPEVIKMNDENQLHCENGPALKYRDGWSIYSWNGTVIPKNWIEDKENLDPTTALTWENVEQRRVAAEIIGWHNVLDQLNCNVIDEDGDPEIGVLVEVDIPEIGRERFLRVRCGTGRDFALPVPPEMKTALQAQAWTWGEDVEEFLVPEVRT